MDMFKALDNYKFNQQGFGTYVKRRNSFESKQFSFDLGTCEAYSYAWWMFVIKIGNVIYFNNSAYSMQTRMHQRMAKNILDSECLEYFGIKVEYVYYGEGLNHLDVAIKNMHYEISKIKDAMSNPRSRKATNVNRLKHIKALKQRIADTKILKRKVDRQLKVNEKIHEERAEKLMASSERRMHARQLARERAALREQLNQPTNYEDVGHVTT